jgi:hypothetical protein
MELCSAAGQLLPSVSRHDPQFPGHLPTVGKCPAYIGLLRSSVFVKAQSGRGRPDCKSASSGGTMILVYSTLRSCRHPRKGSDGHEQRD